MFSSKLEQSTILSLSLIWNNVVSIFLLDYMYCKHMPVSVGCLTGWSVGLAIIFYKIISIKALVNFLNPFSTFSNSIMQFIPHYLHHMDTITCGWFDVNDEMRSIHASTYVYIYTEILLSKSDIYICCQYTYAYLFNWSNCNF